MMVREIKVGDSPQTMEVDQGPLVVTPAVQNALSHVGVDTSGFNERLQSPEWALENLTEDRPNESPGFECVGHLELMSLKR